MAQTHYHGTMTPKLALCMSSAALLVPYLSSVLINVYITTSLTTASIAFDAKTVFDPSKHIAVLEDAMSQEQIELHYPTVESASGDSSFDVPETQQASTEPTASLTHLFPRADAVDSRVRVKVVNESRCFWNSNIQETQTRPLWLVIGISFGAVFGMMLLSYTAFQVGKTKSASMGGGMAAPPPA